MKKQKIGLSATNWILSIIGILVLSCFIILPPVFRVFVKEEVEEPLPPQEVEIKIASTTCQNKKIEALDYNDNETLTFIHHNEKVQSFTRNTVRTYIDPLVYQEQKLVYGKLVTAFSIINGYQYSAVPADDTSSINIKEEYDLTIFKPTTIIVPGDENPTAITSTYQLNDDITSIKTHLTSNGYICTDSME